MVTQNKAKMTTNEINKNISWVNTGLLTLVLFFLARLVVQFDAVAESVAVMNKDVAIMKNTVDRHERELETIKSASRIQTRD